MIGELLPDQPALDNPGVLQAKNVVPYANAYRPVRDLVADTNALDERCRGAQVLQNPTGAVFNYAGDRTKIYLRSGTDYTDTGSGPYNLNEKDRWEFTRWYDTVLAATGNHPVQSGDFGAVLTDAAGAPQAKHITMVRNIVFTGNIVSGGPTNFGQDASGVMWSDVGNPEEWVNGEAGFQHLDEAGSVTKVVGGEYVSIFTEAGIFRGNYVGPPFNFDFDYVVPNKPAPYSGAIVQVGFNIYFLSQDGFYVFNGSGASPISSGKMTRTFFDDLDFNATHLMTSIADLENNLIYFAYPGEGHKANLCNRLYVYNYVTGLWTGPIEQETQQLLYGLTPGTLLDDYPGPDTDNYEDPPGIYADVSVDDPRFLGGDDPEVSAFIPGNFHGAPLGNIKQALIESGEYQHNPGGYSLVSGFRPLVDGSSPVIAGCVEYRNTTYDDITNLPQKNINPRTGMIDQRISARYHRYMMKISGDFESIHGAEPLAVPMGAR